MRTPVRDVLPDSQGAWVRVGDGWLTGRAQPESEEELKSWGADVVVSLQHACEGGGIAHGIVAAAVSARALTYHYVCPVHNILTSIYNAEDCTEFARAVVAIGAHLQRGHKVVVQCDHGQRRTSMAIYVAMLLNVDALEFPMIRAMFPTMLLEFARAGNGEDLYAKVQCVLNHPVFMREYRRELAEFCIGLPSCM